MFMDPRDLRARAEHYRELARQITDAQAQSGIRRLAEQYETLAAELDGGSGQRENTGAALVPKDDLR